MNDSEVGRQGEEERGGKRRISTNAITGFGSGLPKRTAAAAHR